MSLKTISTAVMVLLVLTVVAVAQKHASSPANVANATDTQTFRSQFLNWHSVRMGEIDATLTQWEEEAAKMKGEAREKAESVLADIRARRDTFRETIEKEANPIWVKKRHLASGSVHFSVGNCCRIL